VKVLCLSEQVLDFMEPYVKLANQSSPGSSDVYSQELQRLDNHREGASIARDDKCEEIEEEWGEVKDKHKGNGNYTANDRKKILKKQTISHVEDMHAWDARTFDAYSIERVEERAAYFQAMQAAASSRVSWEHVISAIQSLVEQEQENSDDDDCSDSEDDMENGDGIHDAGAIAGDNSSGCEDQKARAKSRSTIDDNEEDEDEEVSFLDTQLEKALLGSQRRTLIKVHIVNFCTACLVLSIILVIIAASTL
jgi:hypothetical protein